MEVFVDLRTRQQSGMRTRVAVLIIVITAVVVLWQAGYALPEALSVALGSGLVGAGVTPAMLPLARTPQVGPSSGPGGCWNSPTPPGGGCLGPGHCGKHCPWGTWDSRSRQVPVLEKSWKRS